MWFATELPKLDPSGREEAHVASKLQTIPRYCTWLRDVPRRAEQAGFVPDLSLMADPTLKLVLKAMKADEHLGCSDAYRWLHKRHAKIAAARKKHNSPWRSVIGEITAAGIVGGDGKPLTPKSISKIWQRVCRNIQAKAAAKPIPSAGSALKSLRSTAPPNWQPTPVTPSPSVRTPLAADALDNADAEAEAEAEAQLARLRRHVDERSGRKRA